MKRVCFFILFDPAITNYITFLPHDSEEHNTCESFISILKLPFLFIILKNTQMTTLYTNLSLYITFTMIYYIRQE